MKGTWMFITLFLGGKRANNFNKWNMRHAMFASRITTWKIIRR